MDPTIIVAIVGVIGTVTGSVISYYMSTKEYKIKLKEFESNDYIRMLDKYREMYTEMEAKITKLEIKIEILEKENHQLRAILASNGIQTINIAVTEQEE